MRSRSALLFIYKFIYVQLTRFKMLLLMPQQFGSTRIYDFWFFPSFLLFPLSLSPVHADFYYNDRFRFSSSVELKSCILNRYLLNMKHTGRSFFFTRLHTNLELPTSHPLSLSLSVCAAKHIHKKRQHCKWSR